MSQCTYLGHVVGNGEVRPEWSKMKAVNDFPTKKQVRDILGLMGYYQKFIANYAEIAAVLMDLTKKNAPNRVVWNTKCERAF